MHDYPLEQRTIGHMLADKAVRVGDRACLVFGGRSYSFREAHRLSNRFANAFAALGVRKGDHVATMLPNSPELLWTYWGLAKLGAVNVPLNTAARGDLLRYFVEQSDSRIVVVAREWQERMAEAIAGNRAVEALATLGGTEPALGALGLPSAALEEFAEASDEAPPVDAVRFDDPQFIMYTSGTTGPSKGVVSPHAQAHAVGRHLTQHYGYHQDDVLYTCLPLFHGNALWYSCFAAFWADAALAVSSRFTASGFWDEIRACGATQFNALGAMTNILLKAEPSPRERAHTVRQAMVLPLSRESYRAVSERFGVQVTSLYAMTETFPTTMFVPGDPEAKGSSAGKPRGLAEIRIVDEDDRPLGVGETGEICVRPSEPWIMMSGYYRMAEATVRETRNLWLHTGDRAYLDEDGYLFFVDRKKEAIRRRGENISAYEVEMLVAKHPGVAEVAAIAVASELSEDEVMVFVVPAPENAPSEEELVHFCGRSMAHFMVPRFVHFIDALPKTASEKIEKYKLKSWAEANRASLWDREARGIALAR
ncbi:AMP-binding protein [Enterovirga rhinocerotis]|uniref:Crotonobetaine/carnitine-CoA ligase n=1 Tax=Enterovirga rhinocerotis TaxID=1339210 RepID=A0A4R7C1M1_9HYPH|nr:AMP-binding protein [Enterovirga rhinocerotis]TDR90417.1 crotonobetaine/carnitine-CoA ligase [Enterovirga rhinocerotis]